MSGWTSPYDRLRARFRRIDGGFMFGKHEFYFGPWYVSLNEGYYPNLTVNLNPKRDIGLFFYTALWNGFRVFAARGKGFNWMGYGSDHYRRRIAR